RLLVVSPHAPAAVVVLIENDWDNATREAAAWEKRYAGNAVVLGALGRKYAALWRNDDAERCMRASLKLVPDGAMYVHLANFYQSRGNMNGWLEALEEYLRTEDTGLSHAQVRVTIAKHFMAEKKWEKAKLYADAAAASGAAWAMRCAADCYEGLKDWASAEQLMRSTSERYQNSQADWFLWCVRTGHGDREAANKLAAEWIEEQRDSRDRGRLLYCMAYYVCLGKPEEAYKACRTILAQLPNDTVVNANALLLADELGKTKERDETLAKMREVA